MIMIPQFRQNKISGMSIAWGRGSWDNEVGCYVFPTDDSYQIRVTDSYLMDYGICEDDMLDCISQIEEEYGAPSVHRTALGLFKNSGYSNLGLTVISRTNPSISCVFTPTSTEEKLTDAYFEWYFNESDPSVIDLPRYMNRFDNMTGNRASNVTMSPVMPSYMEAQEFFNAHREISESVKENILRGVWQHQTTKDKGFKVRLEREVLPEWTKIKESSMRITGTEMREGLQFINHATSFMESFNVTVDDIEVVNEGGSKSTLRYKIPGRTSNLGGDFIVDVNKGRAYKQDQIELARKKFAIRIKKAYARKKPDVGDVVQSGSGPLKVTKVSPIGHIDGFSLENDNDYEDGRPRSTVSDLSPVYFELEKQSGW